MGLALARAGASPRYFEYFLNPANHKPGIPLDFISYHFYAHPAPSEGIDDWQYTFFDQADGFLATSAFHSTRFATGYLPKQRPIPTSWV